MKISKILLVFLILILPYFSSIAEEKDYYFGMDDYFGYAVSLPSNYPVIFHGISDETAKSFFGLDAQEAEEWLDSSASEIMFLIPSTDIVVKLSMDRYTFDKFIPFITRDQICSYGDYWEDFLVEQGYSIQFSSIFTGNNNSMAKSAYFTEFDGIPYYYIEYNSIFGKDTLNVVCSSYNKEFTVLEEYTIESILDTIRFVGPGYSN